MISDKFQNRLQEIIGGKSVNSFAKECGASEGAIRNYLKGNTTPDLDTLARIAEVSGYSLGWLASGEGPKRPGEKTGTGELNEELLQAVIEAVEEYLDNVKGHLPTKKRAQLIAALYDMFADEEEKKVERATVIRLVKLAI